MKTRSMLIANLFNGKLTSHLMFNIFVLVLIVISSLPISCASKTITAQDPTAEAIQIQLKLHKRDLFFPHSVKSYYEQTGKRLTWIVPDSVKGHGWEALLMLDCVVQFGLNHDDYHPGKLLSIEMHRLIRNFKTVSITEKAVFDIMLTDAIITFINNLHYGKLNPTYTAKILDDNDFKGFSANQTLIYALQQSDFMSAVLSVQPKSKAYVLLQSRMRLMTGQYVGDCYEVPEGQIRKVAINLERLRWLGTEEDSGININIPSATLSFQSRDTVYYFKVALEKGYHIPLLQSKLSYFRFSARAGAPQLELHFPYVSGYDRKFVRVNDGIRLADLLLKNDRGAERVDSGIYRTRADRFNNYYLKNSLPIRLSYLTCADVNGLLEFYDDIYNLDKALENALYDIRKDLKKP